MTKIKLGCIALMLVIAAPLSPAWADRGHGHSHGHHHGHHHNGHHHHRHGGGWGTGLGIGLGLGLLGYGLSSYARSPSYPPAYSYPPAAYAPVVSVPAAPPVYIQQGVAQVPPQAQASNYWHYCRNPEGYYPYVKNCPGGWLQVAPQPVQ